MWEFLAILLSVAIAAMIWRATRPGPAADTAPQDEGGRPDGGEKP
jgi:hypothetical protein